MAVVETIKVELRHERALRALSDAMEEWTNGQRQAFADEWADLVEAGAEVADVQFVGGRVVAYPSEDFTMHLAKWGVHLV
jgi:hypothetical protein